MWLAHRHGRLEEMFAFVHPDIVWWPQTRMGKEKYEGHAGVRELFAEFEEFVGSFRIDFTEVAPQPDGRVRAVGRVVQMTDDGELVGAPIAALFTLRDDLVFEVHSVRLAED
jgi:ketosteroid isomerase-like protein